MMDKDITDPSFRYAPSQNPIDPLNSSSATALPNTMAQQVDFVPSGDDFADTIAKATRQRIADQNNAMMLSMSKAAAGNAEEAAAAQRLGYETGVGSEIAARNKQLLEQRLATDRLAQLDLFRRDPVLARMLANKDFAAVAHDDLPNLMESGEQINPDLSWIDEFLIGRARGYKGTELGLTGMDMLAAKASGVPIPESLRAKAAQQKQELADLRASGGFLESFGALEGNIESTIPKQAEMALYGAVAGGLVLGAPTGGIGMVPGMVAGAGMGVMSAGVVQSFQIEGGNLFVDMLDDGIPEDTALVAAPIGGAIMAALEILPLKFVTGEAKKLIKREVAGQVIDTLKQTGMLDVTKRFLQSYGIGVTTEVGTELAQDAVSTYVQEMAMLATDPLYEEKWKSEKGRAELAKQFVDTFIEVGQGMAIMGAFLPGANFISDARRASKAKATRQFFKDIDKNASESKLKGRNPRSYQEWFEEKARGTANHTLFIDIEKLREAMAKNNVSAEQLETILPGVTKAIADAKGMNGIDFAFPTSVYAARLSDIAFGQALQEHMRFDPNDMSIAENNQYVKEREQIVEEMKQSAMELMKADAAIDQSAQAVTDLVTDQLVAAGKYTESEARSMASVASASATVMSARFNMTPLDWHNKYGAKVFGEGQIAPAVPAATQQVAPTLSVVASDKIKAKAAEFGISESQISEAETLASSIADSDWVGLAFSDEETPAEGLARAQQDIAVREKYKDKASSIITGGVLPQDASAKVDARITTKSLEQALAEIEKVFEENRKSVGVRFVSIGLGNNRATVNLQVQLLSETQIREELANRAKAAKQAQAAPLEQASRIDADYMAAVESGDMETAQRMVDEAAKAAGYTIPVYHFTDESFTAFDVQKGQAGPGIWLTSSPEGWFGQNKLNLYLNPGKIQTVKTQFDKSWREGELSIEGILEGDLDTISQQNIDTLKNEDYTSTFYVATRPEQVKSADPITRDAAGNVIPLSRRFNIASTSILEQAAVPAPSTGVFDARNPPVSSEPIFAVMNADGQIYYDVNATMHGDLAETFPDIADTTIDGGFIIDGKYKMGMSDGGYSAFEGTSEQVEQVKEFTKQANTVPQVLDQAAMAEPAAESVEAVQETSKVINEIDQQIKDEGNTDVNTKTIDEVVFDDRIPIITLQDLVGKTLFPTIADRTAAGAVFTGVDSSKLEVAMELLGGPFFPLRQSNLERGVVWANRGKGVITKKEQLVKGGAKYMVVVLGDVNMHQSNTTVTNAFLALTSAYIRDGRINKENADKLSGLVKNAGVDKESKTRKDLQQFPGFDDLEVLNTYIQKMSFESRKVMLDVLGGAAAFNLGAPSMQKILDATIEPSLAGNRWGDATLVLEIDESQSFIKLGTEGTREHPDYPLGIRGRVVGRFATPINYEHIWKEWFAKTAAQPVKTTKQPTEGVAEPKEKTRQNINRGFDLAKPTVTVTQELADSVGSMTGGNIDGPRQAELATAMVLNKWAVGGVTKVEGGASPQMFVYEVANSEASSVLNEYTKKEVTDGIKKKTFQIYQLNDQKSRIWFATKVGNLGTEYSVQVPELSDSDIALTAVINNEQGARGIAGPAVVLKALEEGVTCLDCFAIKSEKHPIGFLPTLYAEFGFEIVATVPFDSKYYTPTRLKDAENYWAETGWNKERDGYPDVVIMKWRGTEDDRANVTRRYLRDGTAGILKQRTTGLVTADEKVVNLDDRAERGEQQEVADSGTGRGIQGNTRRSLASRALGVAESIAGLTDEQASNYGISLADRDAVKKSIANARVLEQAMPSGPPRATIDLRTLFITLNTAADLTSYLHEMAHFYMATYVNIANEPGAPSQITADLQIIFDWLGIKDLASWNAMTHEEQKKYWEAFGYNHEIYLFEGKSPSIEMQGVFDRFSAWLRKIYGNIRDELNVIYRREFGEDLPMLTPDVRGVMDRMLATEKQIKYAESVNNMTPLFLTQEQSGYDDARWAAYQAMVQEAHDQSVTDLTKASLRQMEWLSNARTRLLKEMQAKHDDIRDKMRSDIAEEVAAEPVYMAMSVLKTGKGRVANGEMVVFSDKYKLNLAIVKTMIPAENLSKLGYGKFGMLSEDGLHPDMVAEMFGFKSGDELVLSLLAAKPVKEEVDSRLDARMLAEYGDMNTPAEMEVQVQKALHNEARERFIGVEARFVASATRPVRAMTDAARLAANTIVNAQKIENIRPSNYAAAEARAARDAADAYKQRQSPEQARKTSYTRSYNEQIAAGVDEATAVAEATKKGDQAAAAAKDRQDAFAAKYGNREPAQVVIRAKQAQVVQNQLVKVSTAALEEVDTAVKDFRKFFGSDEKIAKSRNMDLVDAARAILSYYGFGKVDKNPADYIKKLEAYNPELYAEIEPLISQASTGVRDYTQMTMDDFRMLRDVVDALWAQSRRDKQITVAGKKIALDGVLSELDARLNEIGVPTTVPGEKSALTTKEKFAAHLYSAKALLRRVENWADATDGAGGVGAFTKYIYRPVKDAVNAYRVDRNNYVKRFVDLVGTLDLPVGKITSPELDYTFGVGNGGIGKAELLGAMLHTGNESNYKKLLIGRKWGEFNADESVNTSRWDAFVGRMITEGVLTKEDFDFLQAVWDLNEEIKPIAQRAHRDLYGYYFKEVEATSFTNRFGTYRGGYVPAKTDAAIVRDAQRQAKAEELEADFRSSMPSTGMGFTKGRVEYNKPLSLDVRLMAKHIDDVLRFAHIQPAIKDALRIVNNRAFADKLSSIDPTAVEFMLLPWLNRTARQSTNEPGRNKAIDNFWRTLRSRTGMSIMFANLRNALQQVTGLFPSALKVSKGALKDSLFAYLASPRKTADAIAGLSPFMNERMHSQIFEIQDQMNDLLLNPSKFDNIQKWSQHHGYFLQSAFQNFVDIVTWNGKYNQVLSEIGTTLSYSEAQTEAIQQADAAVRSTQGSMSAEDVAAFEVGSPFYKTFVQFTGYFNMLANLNTDEYVKVLRDLGWRGNKGKLVSIYMLGFLAPTLVADAIARSLGAGWDDDDDGYLDDVADWFFGSQVRAGAAMVPFGSAAYTAFAAGFTARTYDDRITSSPSIGSLEASTVGVGKAVVNLASDDKELTGRNVRDVLTLITNATGVPVSVLGRPIGYQMEVNRGKVEPTDPIDYMRGLITGVPSAESKKK